MNEPAEIYGRLKEGAHFAGYSFERACSHLEWLLDEDRWKISGQFDDVNKFLESIKLDQFRIAVDQRKRLAQRIKELQPDASSRALGNLMGVAHTAFVSRGANAPDDAEEQRKINEDEPIAGANAPLPVADLSGADAAKLVDRATTKDQRYEERRQERFDHIEQVSKGNAPLPSERRYPIVYADPPWRYENAPAGDAARAIENHYPTMALDEICALPVRYMAADAAMLFLWATSPKLADAMAVVAAWGFEYRTNLVWVKDRIGTGYYVRGQHELLLIARRGDMPTPTPGTQPSSVIHAPRGEHSAKPAELYAIIERLYPDLGKIELFARAPRDGWASWGNQSQGEAA